MGENVCNIIIDDDRINIKLDHLPKSTQLNISCDLSQFTNRDVHYLQIEFDRLTENPTHFMSNGFQTWTESRWYDINDSIKNLSWYTKPIWSFFNMKSYGDYNGIQYQKYGLHSFHFNCLKTKSEYIFIGSLNENNGHSIFFFDNKTQSLKILKETSPEQNNITVDYYWSSNKNLAILFNNYFDSQNLEAPNSPVTGWTSWYNYYTKINEDIIVANLHNFIDKNIPIDIFQIDDGWQKAVGDWEINNKFPGGLQAIVDHAHKHNIKAGLWMAPFICEKKSALFKDHPDWLRKDKQDKYIKAGYSLDWSGEFYVLEWRMREVREHLERHFNKILNTWGFDLVKLDFLYAVCLGVDQKSKGQEMSEAMDWLQTLVDKKEILACGVPLSSSFGKVAYCRVSSDVALKWEDAFLAKSVRYRERVSTVNALRSTINRCLLNNNVFINDPDVYILRSENNSLSETQKETLYLINQSLGGLLFTSDNISEYNEGQNRNYLKQFPIRRKDILDLNTLEDAGWVLLKNRELIYLLVYNLSPSHQNLNIPSGVWCSSEGKCSQSIHLASYESKVLLKFSASECQIIHSDGHIFPGMEIEQLDISQNKIDFVLHENCRLEVINYIFEVNAGFKNFYINGQMSQKEIWEGNTVVKYQHKL